MIFSQNMRSVSGAANMSLLVPILTTTDKNFSALATSYLVSDHDMLTGIAKRAAHEL